MLLILRATDPPDPDVFLSVALRALAALATRPGYLTGRVGRAVDDPAGWVVVCEWADVGSGRRGLAASEIRAEIMPLMAQVQPEESTFEVLGGIERAGASAVRESGGSR